MMQVWLNFVLMVALAMMVGISVSVNQSALEASRRQSYIESHPELTQDIVEALEKGELSTDMLPEQVRIIWGNPDHIEVMESHPQMEFWIYPKALVLFDLGMVRDWAVTRSSFDDGKDLARRIQYILANEQLDERTVNLIRKGEITTGMSPEEVQASWGEPKEILPIYNDALGEFVVWVYERGRNQQQTNVTFQEGEVLRWAEF